MADIAMVCLTVWAVVLIAVFGFFSAWLAAIHREVVALRRDLADLRRQVEEPWRPHPWTDDAEGE